MQITLSQILYYAGWILTAVELFSFIFAMVKAIKNKQYNKIKELVIGFIEEAEKLTAKNGSPVPGATKKEVVLSKVRVVCSNFHVKYNETFWSSIIDKYVELTLKVNQRPGDAVKLTTATTTTTEAK